MILFPNYLTVNYQSIASCCRSRLLVAFAKIKHQKKRWCLLGLFVALMLAAVAAKNQIGELAFNQTLSLPHKLFWISFSQKNIKRGDFVAFKLKRCNQESLMMIKIIGGVAGDEVVVNNNQILINDKLIGPLQAVTSTGEALIPLASGTIPAGKIFVFTHHPKSFDSRYQEIGLVSLAEIKGRAYAIF